MDTKEHKLNIRIPEIIALPLQVIAQKTSRSISWHVRQAILLYLYMNFPHTLPTVIKERYDTKYNNK